MKVLLLAPHPFFQERGTPIAVDLLVRVLCERGDDVDIVTFHEGFDRQYSHASVCRIKPWPRVKGVAPGFSAKKLLCDFYLFFTFAKLFFSRRYDLVHAVEESAFMAMLLCPLRRVPFVYDMDSSMVTQMVDKYAPLRWIEGLLRFLESLPMRFATAVVPVCDALADDVRRYRHKHIVILKDVSLVSGEGGDTGAGNLRTTLPVQGKLVMYIGNLETYQGIDLLIDSYKIVCEKGPESALVVVGGVDKHINAYRAMCSRLGIEKNVFFLGKRPVAQIGQLMAQADVLVSPRIQGVNTPMKVYSYLHSGVPVVATALPTHTQVMTEDIAVLTAPQPGAFAAGIMRVFDDPQQARRLATQAVDYIEREHSYDAFKKKLNGLYQTLEQLVAERAGR